MSLKGEIDRTELNKNNLVTIKEQTNTALTENEIENIENFNQLPKILDDRLSTCKKMAKQSINESFCIEDLEKKDGFQCIELGFQPSLVLCLFDFYHDDGHNPYGNQYIGDRDNFIITNKNESRVTLMAGVVYIFRFEYREGRVYVNYSQVGGATGHSSKSKITIREIYYIS